MTTKEDLTSIQLCIDNEYLNKYINIINNPDAGCKNTQKHHIIPRYYFTYNNISIDNSENNLVELSFRNHVLAHYYLCKCSYSAEFFYKNVSALTGMIKRDDAISEEDLLTLLEDYDSLYDEYVEYRREKIYEIKPWEYVDYANRNMHHSPESYKKASEKMKGKYSGMKHVTDGDIELVVQPEELDFYLKLGWKNTRSDHAKKSLKDDWSKGGTRKIRRGYHQTQRQKDAVRAANSHPRAETATKKQRVTLNENIANDKYVWMRKPGKKGTSRIIKDSDKMFEYLENGYYICKRRKKKK